ncbi:UDP-3-O-(R-3-hydroxymyristoyl)-glucosamine N-acyltransferase [Clostridium putrefaciens]|uniref:UDP-3-O-(R-3-hydroxymyristoyl)-glucosamine N-acyltransferase n=1 Tax=Clostridium putrefaciens TaxID=99675 RepID=A0A381J4L7_9CLOT|nr:UDP-3-O-(3-hydroxymyristoyl)glucosamine N-acyltransferase [Clostridium putrefaciens]SUY45812.1 UDP-3-O-(R-3-hydroxymyristoyl)-glucosamine N-acyltransferase [Clostridium putrefaciens]
MKISKILKNAKNDFGICQIVEDGEFETLGLASSEVDLGVCTFIENEKYINSISKNVTMIITKPEIAEKIKDRAICISDDPRISFFKLHNYLSTTDEYNMIKRYKTKIGADCTISKLSCISDENVSIGNNVIIEEFVSIKENTIIGDNTIIRAGTVIGGEGFEFKRMSSKQVLPVNHVGWTVIGESVEIQYNTCVDKAIYPWDQTLIGDNCKVDNLVHVAHGVKLGNAVFLVAGSLIGGRTLIKEGSWIGVGATVSNGLIVDENCRVNIGSVATRSLDKDSNVTGNFAIDHKRFIEFIRSIR